MRFRVSLSSTPDRIKTGASLPGGVVAASASMTTMSRRGPFLLLISSLIVLAWITLLIWEQSPYGRYLNHGHWTEVGFAASVCRVLPAGPVVLSVVLYVGGWLLMSTAMMLPTALPLLEIFHRLTDLRPDRRLLMTLVVLGYLAVWGAFGLVAHLIDASLQVVVTSSDWLTVNGWSVSVVTLMLAGAFQFTALKYHCLDKCRTPLSFAIEHWRGRAQQRQAFLLGAHHGIFCVGCCWAIMLLMFVVGTGSVGWMLMLGALMAIEKNVSWGRQLSAPLGIALICCSLAVLLQHIFLQHL
jgi:predicted metal-binding membrane protein